MSAYVDTRITRSKAKRFLVNHLLSSVSDMDLEDMIEKIEFDARLRRCYIVEDNDPNNEDYVLDQ